jgi:hypothetical protein
VSRAGLDNPFDTPLLVLEVEPPTDTSRPLADADALPLGDLLSWGLRLQTADAVLFSFEGQVGEAFLVDENVPPSGQLVAPENDALVPNNVVPGFAWEADAGNCEDELSLTFALEFLGNAAEPTDLFASELQLTVLAESAEAELSSQWMELDLHGGRWAWGILADDGTDQTALPDADQADRTFRTFILNSSPRFVTGPEIAARACGLEEPTDDALAFSYQDDEGNETVNVTLTYASAEQDVFDSPTATLELPPTASEAEVVVFLVSIGTTQCPEFVNGPGYYGVELDDGADDPVRAVVEYAGPPAGACCFADGSCTEGLQSACTASYQGDGTTCASVECVPATPTGACCLFTGGCTQGTASECTDGVYQGNDTTCAIVDCAPFGDCNSNGVPDGQDIEQGTSNDCDANGVPDECEGVGNVVDAGVLAPGVIVDGEYDSSPNGNDLNGSVCPLLSTPLVQWEIIQQASGSEVFIRSPGTLTSAYLVQPALPGEYVFQLTWQDGGGIADTVTLMLTGP